MYCKGLLNTLDAALHKLVIVRPMASTRRRKYSVIFNFVTDKRPSIPAKTWRLKFLGWSSDSPVPCTSTRVFFCFHWHLVCLRGFKSIIIWTFYRPCRPRSQASRVAEPPPPVRPTHSPLSRTRVLADSVNGPSVYCYISLHRSR